jgi:hypothetical protein
MEPDGTRSCTTCGETFRSPRSCSCPQSHASTLAPGDVKLGTVEQMTLRAKSLGMLDRLGLEEHLAKRINRSDREARFYRKRALQIIEEGVVKRIVQDGEERLIDVDRDAAAVKWAGLAEVAAGRGDKLARALHAVVSDRERRTDLERRERQVAEAQGRPKARA